MTLSEFDYFCSSAIEEPDNFLKKNFFVTSELSCAGSWKSHITMQIFVASIFCTVCAIPNADNNSKLKEKLKTVLPVLTLQ